MLFCPRPAHRDPGGPGGDSLLDWNDAIYRPKRRHFIIQRTLTPWMSNTEHVGARWKASHHYNNWSHEGPGAWKVSIRTKSSPDDKQVWKDFWSHVTDTHGFGLKVTCWFRKMTANSEADGIMGSLGLWESLLPILLESFSLQTHSSSVEPKSNSNSDKTGQLSFEQKKQTIKL